MAEVDVCPVEELPPGTVAAAEIDGTRVCVANVHGEIYAVQDRCPHLLAPLSAGDLNGASIVCPWHDSEFDMRTGSTKSWLPQGIWNLIDKLAPPLPPPLEAKLKPQKIRTFRTRIVDGTIKVTDD
ncbi:MAG TPA: Rieske 2Fe-2S domain-containing protein [Dehalococcoidia bacterium]|nr:Rieske 2Fe-2S domain-containing protein [Dehalococcoidia bacterium]